MKLFFFHFGLTKHQFITCHSSASSCEFLHNTIIYPTIAYVHQVIRIFTHYIKYAASKSTSGIKTIFSSHNEENNSWPILTGMTEGELSWMDVDKTIRKCHHFNSLLIFCFHLSFHWPSWPFSSQHDPKGIFWEFVTYKLCLISLLCITVLDTRST